MLCAHCKLTLGLNKRNKLASLKTNTASSCVAANPLFALKHVKIHAHWSQDQVKKGTRGIHAVGTLDQAADLLTKPLPWPQFLALWSLLGMPDAEIGSAFNEGEC